MHISKRIVQKEQKKKKNVVYFRCSSLNLQPKRVQTIWNKDDEQFLNKQQMCVKALQINTWAMSVD